MGLQSGRLKAWRQEDSEAVTAPSRLAERRYGSRCTPTRAPAGVDATITSSRGQETVRRLSKEALATAPSPE